MGQDHFPNLFEPIQIGRMRLKNRIVMPPMSTNFADPKSPGFVSERHKSYYGERAKGEVGLIIIESTNVNPSKGFRRFGLALHTDQFIPGFKELAESIQKWGAKCAVQLNHGGRIGFMKVDFEGNFNKNSLKPDQYFAASPLPHPMTGTIAKELAEDQLQEIAGYFANAAKRARKAGLDAIELHGGHGYLLNEFLSPYTNKRKDRFGGDIEGRSRFPLLVVNRVKEAVGDDIALIYRMSAIEFVKDGLEINDSIFFAKELEEAGVQIIHISAGLNETPSAMNRVIPPMSFPRGRLVPYAEEIKKEVKIPVIVVQRINTPELADDIIRRGKADLVATGRALIADPHWPLKAQEGRLDEIRRCIACNQGCMEKIVMEETLTCLHNPEVGYENVYKFEKKEKKGKRVLVIGGGLAGMEASYVLAKKGYDVRLIENEDQLGGSARVASVINEKKEFSGVLEYLENQLKKLNVEIKLKEPLNIQNVKEGRFDEIIVATGSTPIVPKMNLRKKNVVQFAKDVLKNPEGVGENIIILGGGSVGIEVAEYLHHLGKDVTVIEMLDKICADLGPLNRVNVLERINSSSIKIMLKTEVLELNDEGILILRDGREEKLKLPDSVVIAMGARPNPLSLKDIDSPIHYVGDCQKVGNAMDAIHGAFQIAVKI
jgi:2,4-dienoyl-CoA reductase-like NADH-dependent reductase (Old Yellow Enzyme family)/thioredoxin reductase